MSRRTRTRSSLETTVLLDQPDESQLEVYATVHITPGCPASYNPYTGGHPEEPAEYEAVITKILDDENRLVPVTPELEERFNKAFEGWEPDPSDLEEHDSRED